MAAIHAPKLLTSHGGRLATESHDYNSFDDIWMFYDVLSLLLTVKGFHHPKRQAVSVRNWKSGWLLGSSRTNSCISEGS